MKKPVLVVMAAGMGSVKSMLLNEVIHSVEEIVDNVEYIELSFDASFNELFIENMICDNNLAVFALF